MEKSFITLAHCGEHKYQSNLLQNFNPRKYTNSSKLPRYFQNIGPKLGGWMRTLDYVMTRLVFCHCTTSIKQDSKYVLKNCLLKSVHFWTKCRHSTRLKKVSGYEKTRQLIMNFPGKRRFYQVNAINFILPSNSNIKCEFKFSKNSRRTEYLFAIYQTS